MKNIVMVALLLLGVNAGAQVQVYGLAGANYTLVTVSPEFSHETSGGYAWQTGVAAQLPLGKKMYLYTAFQYEAKRFDRTTYKCCVSVDRETLRPQFITLPVGAGFEWKLGKNLAFQAGAGVYASIGIGGSVKGWYSPGDFALPGAAAAYREQNISFGNRNGQLRRWEFGLQAAPALRWGAFMLQLQCAYGLSNILPDQWIQGGSLNSSTERPATAQVNIGYRLFAGSKK